MTLKTKLLTAGTGVAALMLMGLVLFSYLFSNLADGFEKIVEQSQLTEESAMRTMQIAGRSNEGTAQFQEEMRVLVEKFQRAEQYIQIVEQQNLAQADEIQKLSRRLTALSDRASGNLGTELQNIGVQAQQIENTSRREALVFLEAATENIHESARLAEQGQTHLQTIVQEVSEVKQLSEQSDTTSHAINLAALDFQASLESYLWLMIILVGGAALFLIVAVWWFSENISRTIRDVTQRLMELAEQTNSESGSVSSFSQSLAEDSSHQAASLEETSSAMEEVDGQIKSNRDNAKQALKEVNAMVTAVQHTAENARVTAEMSQSARRLVESGANEMQVMAHSMNALKESSEEIASIIEVINDITHQTKMLSTNAAIEAARAGEHGKGFAVVADEVSKLAENSRQAAREIAELIRASTERTEVSNQKALEGEQTLRKILEEFRKLDELVNDISHASIGQKGQIEALQSLVSGIDSASEQQAKGVDEVTRAVVLMSRLTQSTAASAEESFGSSRGLMNIADTLQQQVSRLAQMVGLRAKGSRDTLLLSNNSSPQKSLNTELWQ